jgi:hypothetical protein
MENFVLGQLGDRVTSKLTSSQKNAADWENRCFQLLNYQISQFQNYTLAKLQNPSRSNAQTALTSLDTPRTTT